MRANDLKWSRKPRRRFKKKDCLSKGYQVTPKALGKSLDKIFKDKR